MYVKCPHYCKGARDSRPKEYHNHLRHYWVVTGLFQTAAASNTWTLAGTITLSGTLDRVRLASTGTDTFDAGSVNILYE